MEALDVLLIEDNDVDAMAVERQLRHTGVTIRRARTLSETKDILRSWNPDLAIVDLLIPGSVDPKEVVEAASVVPTLVAHSGLADISTVIGDDEIDGFIPKGSPACGDMFAYVLSLARKRRKERETMVKFLDRCEHALSEYLGANPNGAG